MAKTKMGTKPKPKKVMGRIMKSMGMYDNDGKEMKRGKKCK